MTYEKIEWHQRGHHNWKLSIDKNRLQLMQEQKNLKEETKRWEFKEEQIKEAIKQGKESFDDEKFLIKKGTPKVPTR